MFSPSAITARERGDNGTRDALEHLLRGEEEHLDWLEAQLLIIEQTGLERFLLLQVHD